MVSDASWGRSLSRRFSRRIADGPHSVARMHVEKRLAPDAKPVQDMLQSHIAGGMTAEELMQQVLVAM